ncbi:MAG TPA: glycosyltransferase family 87 protein [bacterium]|nr:glycosyltransferase family 87 protein [bacterium]HQO37175.1 glycosyltransferase family 87 protein [bacterium]
MENESPQSAKPPRPSLSLNPILVILVLIALLAFAYTETFVIRSGKPGIDLRFYTDASRSILHGKSPYEEAWWYIYPPPLAVLLIPLAPFSHKVSYILWTILGIIAYGYSAYRSGWLGQRWRR